MHEPDCQQTHVRVRVRVRVGRLEGCLGQDRQQDH